MPGHVPLDHGPLPHGRGLVCAVRDGFIQAVRGLAVQTVGDADGDAEGSPVEGAGSVPVESAPLFVGEGPSDGGGPEGFEKVGEGESFFLMSATNSPNRANRATHSASVSPSAFPLAEENSL